MLDEISFDERGLVPCVVQDEASAEVLMLAYVNAIALQLSLETGEMHFFSRSRNEIWRKGETSGMTMAVKQLRYDCDGDAVLVVVDQDGNGACHTGARSCFYRSFGTDDPSAGPGSAPAHP
jgi:phosphoribosyl-AMP cyclohydrolase